MPNPNPELYWQSEEAARKNEERAERAREQLRYDREQADRSSAQRNAPIVGGVVAGGLLGDGLVQAVAIAALATFPGARRVLLGVSLIVFFLSLFILIVGVSSVPPGSLDQNARGAFTIFFVLPMGGLVFLSFVGLIVWACTAFIGNVVPGMVNRWSGEEEEEAE